MTFGRKVELFDVLSIAARSRLGGGVKAVHRFIGIGCCISHSSTFTKEY